MVILLAVIAVAALASARASASQGPPAYDEEVAVKAMQLGVASYAGFNNDARFAASSSLKCIAENCSLPSTLNVSFLQTRELLDGGVVAAGMVARDSTDESIVVAFAGGSMELHGILDLPKMILPGDFVDFNVAVCPGPVKTNKAMLKYYNGMRADMIKLIQAYATDRSGGGDITLRLSGYSMGTVIGALAALDIKSMIAAGILPSSLKLAPIYFAGQLPFFDEPFVSCYTKVITNVTGHFGIHHGRDPMGFIQVIGDGFVQGRSW